MNINISQFIDGDHLSHFWYGGECVTIEYNGCKAIISALGDIAFEYKDEYFKDKNNKWELYSELNDSDMTYLYFLLYKRNTLYIKINKTKDF